MEQVCDMLTDRVLELEREEGVLRQQRDGLALDLAALAAATEEELLSARQLAKQVCGMCLLGGRSVCVCVSGGAFHIRSR